MATPGGVRIAVNIRLGNTPLPAEVAIATALAEQLGISVLLRGSNVAGGDALLTLSSGRRVRAEFKTLHAANVRAFERHVRQGSRQTGAFPAVVVIDARAVGMTAADVEACIDRALGLVVPRRPRLQAVIVLTQERLVQRNIGRL